MHSNGYEKFKHPTIQAPQRGSIQGWVGSWWSLFVGTSKSANIFLLLDWIGNWLIRLAIVNHKDCHFKFQIWKWGCKCHASLLHKNYTIVNAHGTPILRTFKLFTTQKLYNLVTILWLLWAWATQPYKRPNIVLSPPPSSLLYPKATSSLIHPYP